MKGWEDGLDEKSLFSGRTVCWLWLRVGQNTGGLGKGEMPKQSLVSKHFVLPDQ